MTNRIIEGKRETADAIAHEFREGLYDVVYAATRLDPRLRLGDSDIFIAFLDKALAGARPTPKRTTGGALSRLLSKFLKRS